jgi:pseudaminic acid biosynthesis-associated methylase
MQEFTTEQEKFWAGEFGGAYIERNKEKQFVANNIALFARVLKTAGKIDSVIEFGANVGLNLSALYQLLPLADFSAVEINSQACEILSNQGFIDVHNQSILDFTLFRQYDFSFIKGVLIHIAPESLPAAYDILYKASKRYICIAEYYNPSPVDLDYRGHSGKLFKRDFAGEMLDKYDDLELVDYGFVYRRDSQFPQDDITWFLLKKAV